MKEEGQVGKDPKDQRREQSLALVNLSAILRYDPYWLAALRGCLHRLLAPGCRLG